MAPQADRLTRIAHEGFALIDEFYGQPAGLTGRSSAARAAGKPLVYQGPQISTVRVPVLSSNEVTRYYSGLVLKEPAIINSDEAAQRYNGFAIVEHGRKRGQFRSAYD